MALALLLMLSTSTMCMDITQYQSGKPVTNSEAHELVKRFKSRNVQEWKDPPALDALSGHENAELIRYGIQVLDKTVLTIGPKVSDLKKRFSGNSLNCSSCHLKGGTGLPGTKYDAIPFSNMVNDYPQFRGRGMSIVSAEMRINGCMTRSMGNGRSLPSDSREMLGMLAYFDWLAEGTQKDQAMKGTNLPKIDLPNRRANVQAGEKVYKAKCLACHGADALGMKAPEYAQTGNYVFPPLAGEDSFNDGAGMSRLIKATQFIHANMPLGAISSQPQLSVDDAYDVAAYMLSLQRPHRDGRDKDFPDPDFRPADYPVPGYFGDDSDALKRAKLGPYNSAK